MFFMLPDLEIKKHNSMTYMPSELGIGNEIEKNIYISNSFLG